MTDPAMQQVLDRLDTLQATVDTQTRLLAQYEGQSRRKRTTRRLLPLALAAFLVALIPLSSLAAITFNDLNPNSVHNPNIQAIADAGITTGCDPGIAYCPNRTVTREEMASFLARTAGLGSNPPVTNAKTAQSATTANHAGSADTATMATNATHSNAADNANMVGGYMPSGLTRVARGIGGGFVALPMNMFTTGAALTITVAGPGFVLVNASITYSDAAAFCPSRGCTGTIRLRDTTSGAVSPDLYATNNSYLVAMAATYVFPVTAGPHTYALEIASDTTNTAAINGVITALFSPFAQDGGMTLVP